jgi:hypothetical protein
VPTGKVYAQLNPEQQVDPPNGNYLPTDGVITQKALIFNASMTTRERT